MQFKNKFDSIFIRLVLVGLCSGATVAKAYDFVPYSYEYLDGYRHQDLQNKLDRMRSARERLRNPEETRKIWSANDGYKTAAYIIEWDERRESDDLDRDEVEFKKMYSEYEEGAKRSLAKSIEKSQKLCLERGGEVVGRWEGQCRKTRCEAGVVCRKEDPIADGSFDLLREMKTFEIFQHFDWWQAPLTKEDAYKRAEESAAGRCVQAGGKDLERKEGPTRFTQHRDYDFRFGYLSTLTTVTEYSSVVTCTVPETLPRTPDLDFKLDYSDRIL